MNRSRRLDADGVEDLQILWQDAERALCRGLRRDAGGEPVSVLLMAPVAEHPAPQALDRLVHEYGLKDSLDEAWAARPIDLVRDSGRAMLVLEDPGGEPLERLLSAPMETGRFLRLAIDIASALGQAHQHGLVHKDVKPANILVNCADGRARLTGFGVASRLQRERQRPEPPEIIAGTLAYMAPEQTGRVNRSIDSRSDLYALGVTAYRMLTGVLPFTADDPMEWVHCHIARRPTPPVERRRTIPTHVSDIVMKLLAKPAEERYQTAAGLERDLRRCLEEWERDGRIDPFPLGERDVPGRLVIPEKLYGREREVEALLAAFDRVVGGGQPELVLVSGYSGIGKSSVVNELQKALVPARGQFASGKFDQLKRDVPYATLAQAFRGLLLPLLGKSEAEVSGWRDGLREALGPNGGLIADLVPEIALIIGEQPPAPQVEPQQAKARFQLVLRRFVGMFAKPEHPLALFLDDLQWLDAATLDFIEDVLIRSDLGHLLLIGAYRDNEVDPAHPLTRKLAAIREAGGRLSEITLGPLAAAHVRQLIADALGSTLEDAAPLTQLVQAKTAGNPFFVLQFLHALADEGLLALDPESQRWSSDLVRIRDKGYTDNVVDLMVSKLARLSIDTQEGLGRLACLGAAADVATLALLLEASEDEVHALLWEAVRLELIERLPGVYRFVHDRVQEAAYSLIPEHERSAAHLRIGRLLVAQTPAVKQEESIFDIVGQLNRGAASIASQVEREQLAELNLIAGKRAKASAAYASALSYLAAGSAMLAEDRWDRRHELAFALGANRAECEFLTGALAEAEARLARLRACAEGAVEQAIVSCLQIDLYMAIDQASHAVEIGLDYLRQAGVDWPPCPTDEDVRHEYERIWVQLGGRAVEELIDLPPMTDPKSLAILEVLIRMVPPAVLTSVSLGSLVLYRAVNLSLEGGNCDASCYAYAQLATILGPRFDDYLTGSRFARLGYDLVERRGLRRFAARTYLQYGYLIVWTEHVRAGRDLLRRAFDVAAETGDLTNAAYACDNLNSNYLAAGDPLPEAQREAERGLAFARSARVGFVIDLISSQLAFIRTLRGLTPKFGLLEDEQFNRSQFERRLSENPDLAIAECWYRIRMLQARFFAGDYARANEAAARAGQLLWTSPGKFETAEYHFYAALSCAAACDRVSFGAEERAALEAHLRQLEIWAENCPENFENRAALVGAEIARLEGREIDAERSYERAIRSARANAFIHNEALAYELAARFYAARGFDDFAETYLRKARDGYMRWGAVGKVRQLDELHPRLGMEEPQPAPTSTIGAAVERLDLATVIKVSQAISGEIVFEKLINTLMRIAIEHAGAERGLLILSRGAEQRIEAEATTAGDTVNVNMRDAPVAEAMLPGSVLRYVLRARESVILDDARAQSEFAEDPYIRRREVRSVLCLPLLNQARLIGVLYLENNLAPRVFAPARIAVLKLLASQAAIALENTHLYRDLAVREAKIRRLVDANIIGIFTADLDGPILEANDAFLRIVGYDRADLEAGLLRWTELTPPDWRERDKTWIEEHRRTGIRSPIEKEYFRKDGSRVPILLGSASVEDRQAVTFVLDLTDRKRAEEALRESEERFRTLMQFSFEVYWETDAEHRFVRQEFSERLGDAPPAGSEIGKTRWEVAYLEPDEEAWRKHRETLDAHLPFRDFELVRPTADGGRRYVSVSGLPFFDKAGSFIGYRGVALHITERKQMEEALRQREKELREVIDRIPAMTVMALPDGTTMFASRRWTEYSGLSTENSLGLAWKEAVHPDDLDRHMRRRREALASGEPFESEVRLRRAIDGEYRWFLVRWEPHLDEGGHILRWYGILADIENRKRTEAALHDSEARYRETQTQLAHANRVEAMGQLTASIAHEVNQPIAATVTNAQAALRWLGAEPPDLDEVRQALGRIVRDGSRAGAVVGRIRNIVKKAPRGDESVDINAAIREVIELTRSEASKNGVTVRTELAEGLLLVQGDRVELQQVTLNLILNAIEAMSALSEGSRELEITTDRTESADIQVMVRDSGPGLEPAALENLFKAFHTTKPDGLGLGLSICRSIIEAHEGRLWASANVPRGAVFQFSLPARRDGAPRP